MKKSSLFISAILTTFMLAVLAGVFITYSNVSASSRGSVPQTQPAQIATGLQATLSARDASQIAARFLGRTDLYAVESASFKGVNAYKVTFSSGAVVYVSLQGQILSSIAAPSVTVGSNAPAVISPARSNGDDGDGGDD